MRLSPGVAAYAGLRFAADFARAGVPGRFDAFGLTTAQIISVLGAAGI